MKGGGGVGGVRWKAVIRGYEGGAEGGGGIGRIFGFRRQVHSSSGTACASLSQQVLQEEPEHRRLEGLFGINAATAALAAGAATAAARTETFGK